MDGFYIAPAFMDKLVVHISKNFMKLPNIKVQFYRKLIYCLCLVVSLLGLAISFVC